MKRLNVRLFGLALLALGYGAFTLSSSAQAPQPVPAQPRTVEVQGKIIRTGTDQFIVQTRDNKQVTLFVNPRTKYLMKDKAVLFTDLRVGVPVTVSYITEGDRFIGNTVNIVEENVQPAVPVEGTVLEGEVVRVIGQDQVVVRTAGNKEVIVFVDPKTTYLFDNKPGQFVDLRPGAGITINYDVRDQKNFARRIVGPLRRR